MLLLALLLSACLLGPALGGRVAWVHSHGDHEEPPHLHLLAAPQVDDAPAHGAWRVARHHHERDGRGHEHHGSEPAGLVLHVPLLLALPSHGTRCASLPGPPLVAPPPLLAWRVESIGGGGGSVLRPPSTPPRRGSPSGVVALLRSSHALLI